MRAILASVVLASLVSYTLNTVTTRRMGPMARPLVAPVIEEVSKTGLSLLLGALILPVHVGFGVVEGLLEYRTCSRVRTGAVFVCSLISHSLFGAITAYTYAYTKSPWAAVSAAVLLHSLWNAVVYDLTRLQKRS